MNIFDKMFDFNIKSGEMSLEFLEEQKNFQLYIDSKELDGLKMIVYSELLFHVFKF